MTESGGHPSPEVLHRLLEPGGETDRTPALEDARRHVAACALCRERFSDFRAAERKLQGLSMSAGQSRERGAGCPADGEWAQLAAGLLDESQAERFVEHAAGCEYCGRQLSETFEDLAGELTPEDERLLNLLPSSQPEGRKRLASQLAAAAKAQTSNRQWPQRQWPWAIASAVVVAIVIAGVGLRGRFGGRPGDAASLLAEAYSTHREMELRIPGARYATLSTERGAVDRSRRLALLRAEVMIDRHLDEQTASAVWLALNGRADLLEGKFRQAQATLERALRLEPNSPEIFTDLATAYDELAQQESRDDDYLLAAARLTDALRVEPDNAVALFNRALVYEQIGSYPLAIEDWERYLRVDPSSAWAEQEAKQHLVRLKKRVNAPPQSELAPTAPIEATAWLEQRGAAHPLANSGEEQLLDVALSQWLPDALAPSASSSGSRKAAERAAVARLATVLAARHGDRWLSDVLVAPRSMTLAAGATALAAAIRSNAKGHPDAAEVHAVRAESLLRAADDPAAALRAKLELAYALQREEKDLARCAATARSALQSLGGRRYPWIQAQLLLELASGEAMQNHFGAAQQAARDAIQISRESDYGTLYLRSIGFAGGIASELSDYRQAWKWDRLGLEQYWAGSYPRAREYQFYADMDFAAEAAREWPLAEALAREALGSSGHSSNLALEALARFRVAKLATAAGDRAIAREEFQHSARIFASLPPDPTFATYRAWCQIDLAGLEVETGAPDRALARLHWASPLIRQSENSELNLRFYRGLGEAYLARGDVPDAEEALLTAVRLAERGLGSLATETDRVAWASSTSDAYRSLVRAELKGRADPVGALGVWEWYRSGPARVGGPANSPTAAPPAAMGPRSTLPESFPADSAKWLRREEAQLGRETVVSYAQFSDGIEIWAFDNAGIANQWVALPASELKPAARRFGEECADPGSDLAGLRQDGRQLYRWLIAPIENRLSPDRVLVFETDGVISRVPFPALLDAAGSYLGSRYAVVMSRSLDVGRPGQRRVQFSANDSLLAIGAPAIDGEWQTMLAALPEADNEARAVASNFHSAVVLSGEQATLPQVLDRLAEARIFHFAGHALVGGRQTGLVLAPEGRRSAADEGGAALLAADRLTPRRLRQCRLAVLSACSTASAKSDTIVDPESLVGAFLLAGVPDVVASRWNVNSAVTAELMKVFYRHLLAGESVAGALQGAAETIRRNPQTAHPYYWAAFSVYGQG
ncbi:MAG TPA: CHAT domain-containing protein [Candidatus Acidoferrales bacterium]|nr:CHAT domain-containing protein [Candidatus Acidoferrales bacterium]